MENIKTVSMKDIIPPLQEHCENADLNELNRISGYINEEGGLIRMEFDDLDAAYSFIACAVCFYYDSEQIINLYNFVFNKEVKLEDVDLRVNNKQV